MQAVICHPVNRKSHPEEKCAFNDILQQLYVLIVHALSLDITQGTVDPVCQILLCISKLIIHQTLLKLLVIIVRFFSLSLIVSSLHTYEIQYWPRVHKAFQNVDQDQAQVKHSFTMDFLKTYYNYITIDCWYLIQYVL